MACWHHYYIMQLDLKAPRQAELAPIEMYRLGG
jgi:hypothetical protein